MMPSVIHCIEIGCYISTHPFPNLGWRERLCRLVLPFHLYIFCSPWSSFKLVYFLLPFRGKRSSMGWEGVPKWPPEHYTCWWRSNEPGCVAEHQQRLGQTTWTLQLLQSIFFMVFTSVSALPLNFAWWGNDGPCVTPQSFRKLRISAATNCRPSSVLIFTRVQRLWKTEGTRWSGDGLLCFHSEMALAVAIHSIDPPWQGNDDYLPNRRLRASPRTPVLLQLVVEAVLLRVVVTL